MISDDLHGAQQYYGVWKIYTKSLHSRNDLLSTGYIIKNINITMYDKNPFDDKYLHSEKITILDLPLSLSDESIAKYLSKHQNVKLQTNVLYGKITNEDNSLSCFENGDRFVYASTGQCWYYPSTS